jgi:hypothetical protein
MRCGPVQGATDLSTAMSIPLSIDEEITPDQDIDVDWPVDRARWGLPHPEGRGVKPQEPSTSSSPTDARATTA